MRLFAAAALILLPPASLAAQSQPSPPAIEARAESDSTPKPRCDRFGRLDRAGARAARLQRLDRLPPGDLHLTVERQVDGCHQPVIVRENIGGAAFR